MANESNLRYLNKLLLEGDNRLTENENIDVFKIVETFIEKRKRFKFIICLYIHVTHFIVKIHLNIYLHVCNIHKVCSCNVMVNITCNL